MPELTGICLLMNYLALPVHDLFQLYTLKFMPWSLQPCQLVETNVAFLNIWPDGSSFKSGLIVIVTTNIQTLCISGRENVCTLLRFKSVWESIICAAKN